jgi:hypothetical protein
VKKENIGDSGLRAVRVRTGGARYSVFDLVHPMDILASSELQNP